MGTIQSSIQLYNGTTSAFRGITNAINVVISSFESLERASASGIDTSALRGARAEINQIEVAMNQVDSAIQRAENQQTEFNQKMQTGHHIANGLNGILQKVGMAFGVKQVLGLADEISRSTARLSLMAGGMENVKEIQEQIYQSAQRTRTSYMGTMDAVAKLGTRAGDAFRNTNETIAFVEQLNKQFKISGASQQEVSSATLQLTQALGSGVLRGEEFNAVFEAAPSVMQTVADYMDVPIGKLRGMAGDGEITADIVKNAMFAMAEDTNRKFETIPMTWADVWTTSVNKVIQVSQPLLEIISAVAQNFQFIEPIIAGVAFTLGLYTGALTINKMAVAAHTLAEQIHAIGMGSVTLANFQATAAQYGFNAALLACPITWIVFAIIAVIAVLYIAVAAINKVKGTSISATGIIVGVFYWMGARIYNGVALLWNIFAVFINWLENAFQNPAAAAKSAFYDMCATVIGYVTTMASAIESILNKIPGVQVNITNGLSRFKGALQSKSQGIKDKAGLVDAVKKMDYKSFQGAYATGYSKGSNLFGGGSGAGNSLDTAGMFTPFDGGDLGNNAAKTADNTGRMADKMEMTEEDLKYLLDVAEREAINRFTTAEIHVDFKSQSTINSDLDIDGVINTFTEKLQEAVDVAAEEVHPDV